MTVLKSVQQVNVTKQQFCISFLRKQKGIWLGIVQQPVNAGSGETDGGTRGRPLPLACHFEIFGPPVTALLILLSDL